MRELLLMAALLIQLEPAASLNGSISGRLLEWDKTPVARNLVVVRPVDFQQTVMSYQAFTDPSGAFHFEGVRPGNYFITVNSLYYPGVMDRDAASVITIATTNSAINGLEFVLPVPPPGFRVAGRVVLPQNTVLAEEQRVVSLTSGGGPFRRTTVAIAADGSFELRNVSPGNYSLQLPYIEATEEVEITVGDRDVTGIDLKVPRFVTVFGTVGVEGRVARPSVSLAFDGPMPQHLATTRTRADGTFEMRLIEGDYRLEVGNLPAGYYLKSFTFGSVNLLTQTMKADGASPPVRLVATLTTSDGVKVNGHVKASAGDLPELPSRRVTFVSAATRAIASAPVNADGSFELNKMMPGTYAARVSLDAFLSSAPLVVVIPDKDTKGVDLIVPGLIEVFGRVVVDRNGPPPKFSLLLLRGTGINFKSESKDELPSVETSWLNGLADRGTAQVIRVEVEPLPDGTFKMMLPEGGYRVASEKYIAYFRSQGVPEPFFIRFLNYGSARLFTEPMVVSPSEPAQLQVGFGTKLPNPWVMVSGHVTGRNPSDVLYRVSLQGGVIAKLETPVNPDGSFEFPMVLSGEEYTASIVPASDATTVARIHAAAKDVKGIEIVIPAEREVTVRASVEGGGPVPGFQLNLQTTPCREWCASSMSLVVRPERNGTVRVNLPEDERTIDVSGLPLGYAVQSLTYRGTDLRKASLKIAGPEPGELEVKFAIDPNVPTSSVRGRVSGLDADSGYVQLLLHSIASVSTFEVPVNPDGSFVFSKIPQGTYVPALPDTGIYGLLDPSSIVVTGKDLIGLQIVATHRPERLDRPPVASATETEVSELGAAAGESASESAAVANLRTINTAQVTYLSVSQGKYGTLQDLLEVGLLDESFLHLKSGYNLSIVANGQDYIATAVPAAERGRFSFYSTPDAVVRFSLSDVLSPAGQSGRPYLH